MSSLPQRFWKKVDKNGANGCWNWTSSISVSGYGVFGMKRIASGAHRFAYEDAYEPIPAGKTIDHKCRNRRCVNPEHLEVVSIGENLRRGDTIISNRAKHLASRRKPKRPDLIERLKVAKEWMEGRNINHYGVLLTALYPNQMMLHRQRLAMLWSGTHKPSDDDERIIDLLERAITTVKSAA